MIFTTENYGSFRIDGFSNVLKVTIVKSEEHTPEGYVRTAIKFVKQMKCVIQRQVEFDNEKGITFEVKCSSKTSRFIYEYGSSLAASCLQSVTDNDIKAYIEKFGTDKCAHPGFQKKYWYSDNWTGRVHYFDNLTEAKKEAKKETGQSVSIYTNAPCCNYGSFVCYAEASGITPP